MIVPEFEMEQIAKITQLLSEMSQREKDELRGAAKWAFLTNLDWRRVQKKKAPIRPKRKE